MATWQPTDDFSGLVAKAAELAGPVIAAIFSASDGQEAWRGSVQAALCRAQRDLLHAVTNPAASGAFNFAFVNTYFSYDYSDPGPTFAARPEASRYIFEMAASNPAEQEDVSRLEDRIRIGFESERGERIRLTEFLRTAEIETHFFIDQAAPGASLVMRDWPPNWRGQPRDRIEPGLQWYRDILFDGEAGCRRRYVHLGLPNQGLLPVGTAGVYFMARDEGGWNTHARSLRIAFRSFLQEILLAFVVHQERRHEANLLTVFGHHLSGFFNPLHASVTGRPMFA